MKRHEFIPSSIYPAFCGFRTGDKHLLCWLPATDGIHMPEQVKASETATEGQESVSDAPERIRVVVRPGKDNWIGIAYAANAPEPDKIRDYIRADRIEALTKALQGLLLAIPEVSSTRMEKAVATARAALAQVEQEGQSCE